MVLLIFILGILGWIVCGFVGGGFVYAHFQGEYPEWAEVFRRSDRSFASIFVVFGPLGLLAILLYSRFGEHGWWIWPRKR